jgi:hypothetical protein
MALAERIVWAAWTPADCGPMWRLVFRLSFQGRPFEFWTMPGSGLADWRAVADWAPGAKAVFAFPGGRGSLTISGASHALFDVSSVGGGRGYPIRKDDLCAALHAALGAAVAAGWLFGRDLHAAYQRWRSEPGSAESAANASAANDARVALWVAESHRVFLAALAGDD